MIIDAAHELGEILYCNAVTIDMVGKEGPFSSFDAATAAKDSGLISDEQFNTYRDFLRLKTLVAVGTMILSEIPDQNQPAAPSFIPPSV